MLTEQHRRDLEKTIKQQRKELRRLQSVEQASWSMLWRFKDERDTAAREITQLRAELERERELADRLLSAGQLLSDMIDVNLDGLPKSQEVWYDAVRNHATRRNK